MTLQCSEKRKAKHLFHWKLANGNKNVCLLVPPAPENVQAIRTGIDSIRILWKPVAFDPLVGPIEGYKVYYRPVNSSLWSMAIVCGSCKSVDLKDLERYTSYQFRVAAFSVLGDGGFSPTFGVLEGNL